MVKHISLVLLIPMLLGCGGVSGTKYLASEGAPEGGHLDVVEGGKEYVLTKGIELGYVYKDGKGIDRSIPIHLTEVQIGPPQQEQIFTAVLTNGLDNKGFATCKELCSGYHYSLRTMQTGVHHGSRAWNWIGLALIAVPTSTTRIQLEGVLEDPKGNPVFIYADKRAAKAFATSGEDIIDSEIVNMAEDIAFELATMTKYTMGADIGAVKRAPIHRDVRDKKVHTSVENTNTGSTSVQPGISRGEGPPDLDGVDDTEFTHPTIKRIEKKPMPRQSTPETTIPQPNDAEGYFLQGIAYSKSKQFNKAMWAYKAAINLDPTYADAHYNLAVICKKEALYNLARYHAEKAAQYQPNMKKAYKLLDELQELQR